MTEAPGQNMRDAIRAEVVARLAVFARGRAQAVTGERLAELVSEALRGRGLDHHLQARTLRRRVSEAVAELVESGEPIASSSRPPLGYWWAESADDLEESVSEAERRARMALRRRRLLRMRMAELRGQERLRAVPRAPEPPPEPHREPEQLGLLAGRGVAA